MTDDAGTSEVPLVDVACTLAHDELPHRQEQWRRLMKDSLISAHPRPTGIELRFESSDATAAAVATLVEAERQCCAFLAWAVARAAHELVVDIAGPAGSEAIFDDWARSFRP